MVEVQKLEFFCDSCVARATLCGDRRGRGAKTHLFLHFLRCADEPSAKIGVVERLAVPARPSAGIGVIEVQNLEVFAILTVPALVEGQKLEGFFGRFCKGIVRVDALSLWRLSQSRCRGFDSPLVRGSSSWKIATFKYESSRRSTLSQLWLENLNF